MKTGISGELVPHLYRAGMVDSPEWRLQDSEYTLIVGAVVLNRIIKMMDPQTLNQY